MPHSITPRKTAKWSRRVAYATTPLPLIIGATWSMGWLLPDNPPAVVMLFIASTEIWCVAAVSAILAHCHLAIANAFQMGVKVGQQTPPAPSTPVQRTPSLRAVE